MYEFWEMGSSHRPLINEYTAKNEIKNTIEAWDNFQFTQPAAKKKLENMGCKYIANIEAPIAAGSTDAAGRLIMGLKNKTAEVGGNAVISSLESNMGFPVFTKGIVYKCEKDLTADGV